jgi:hypothetical protein
VHHKNTAVWEGGAAITYDLPVSLNQVMLPYINLAHPMLSGGREQRMLFFHVNKGTALTQSELSLWWTNLQAEQQQRLGINLYNFRHMYVTSRAEQDEAAGVAVGPRRRGEARAMGHTIATEMEFYDATLPQRVVQAAVNATARWREEMSRQQ